MPCRLDWWLNCVREGASGDLLPWKFDALCPSAIGVCLSDDNGFHVLRRRVLCEAPLIS